ncbi:MAG: zinc ribbon domain-containing protein [Ruminococcaceae bacterium]|nr:zinc ribbon domain-containing protein [Oscillospiraceae bacterium]
MFCKHCGKQIDDTANACPYCGTGVTRKVSDTNPTGAYNSRVPQTVHQAPDTKMTVHMSKPYQAPSPKKKKKKSAVKIIVSVVALILVAAIAAGTFFFIEKKKEEEAQAHREKLTQLLEEKTTKPVIEMYFEDYDNNGSVEAFALVGEKSKGEGEDVQYTDADLYYVSDKNVQLIDEKITGKVNGILTAENGKYISLENEKSGSSHSYIFGVKNSKPFESASSGIYYEVHQDDDRIVGKKEPDGGFIEVTISNETLELKADYEDVLNQYREVVKNRLDFDEAKDNFGEFVSPLMVLHLSEGYNYGNRNSSTLYRIYYSVFDLNNDNIEECVVGMGTDENNVTVYEMFSFDRSQSVPLFEIGKFGERTNLTVYENGTLYVSGSNGASSQSYKYYTIPKNSSSVQEIASFTCEDYQYYQLNSDGTKEEISDEVFHSYQEENGGAEFNIKWAEITYNGEDPTTIPEPQAGDIIEFGYYPQTRVTDQATIAQLNNSVTTWQSYNYYSAIVEDGLMSESDFMKFCDVSLDGEKYRAVKFTQYRPGYTTSAANAGNSSQDENGYSVNTVYWFKYEPIEWRILDPETGLVMCESIIDSQAFSNTVYLEVDDVNADEEEYWTTIYHTNYANDYSASSIRQWLNNDFYNTAFDSEMKSEILSTYLSNVNPENSSHRYSETYDKVFLLSVEEINNTDYGFSASADKEKRAIGTDYAKCQGLMAEPTYGVAYYWLRSPHTYSRQAWIVGMNGECISGNEEHVDETDVGIRPAMRLADLTLL